MALLVMALADLGVDPSSFTGSQVGIITDDDRHGRRSLRSGATASARRWRPERYPWWRGSRASRPTRESPRSAAAGPTRRLWRWPRSWRGPLRDLHRRHRGVHGDPRIVPRHTGINRISFEEMLEMAATGGRVLDLRPSNSPGTTMSHCMCGEQLHLGARHVGGGGGCRNGRCCRHRCDPRTSEAKVTVSGSPGPSRRGSPLFRALADKSINVDMIVQNTSAHGTRTSRSRSPPPISPVAVQTSQVHADELGASGVTADAEVAAGLAGRRRDEVAPRGSPRQCSRRSPTRGSTST